MTSAHYFTMSVTELGHIVSIVLVLDSYSVLPQPESANAPASDTDGE